MKHLFKRSVVGVLLAGTMTMVSVLPGTVQPVAAQDAENQTIFLPFVTAGTRVVSSVIEEQNYTMTEAVDDVSAAATDAQIRRLRPSRWPSYEVAVTTGIVYGEALVVDMEGEVSTTELLLDLYAPVNAPDKLRPTILIVHGGAFLRGSRLEPALVRAAHEYASRGYVVASIDYRLGAGPNFFTAGQLGPFPIVSERVAPYQALVNRLAANSDIGRIEDPALEALLRPLVNQGQGAAMDDTLTAIDWLESQENALLLDLKHLVLLGGSAGSITSLHVAYALDDLGIDAPRVAAVIDFWGGFNLDDEAVAKDGPRFMEQGEAAIFIVHGTADATVPFINARNIFQQAKNVNLPAKFERVVGAEHGFSNLDIHAPLAHERDTLVQRSIDFLQDVLYAPKNSLIVEE